MIPPFIFNRLAQWVMGVGLFLVVTITVLMTLSLSLELAGEVWWGETLSLIPDVVFDWFFAIGIGVSTLALVISLVSLWDSYLDHRAVRESTDQNKAMRITADANLISNLLIATFSVFLLSSLLLGFRFPPVGLHQSLWILRLLLAFTLLALSIHFRVYRFRMREHWEEFDRLERDIQAASNGEGEK